MVKTTRKKIQEILTNQKVLEGLFLVSIFFVAFLTRRIGLKYGFPLLTHPDEPITLDPVYYMTVNRTFNPNDFKRPDQIHYFVYFFYLNIISLIKFGKSFAQTYLDNQLTFYYHARLLIAVIGSLIPVIAYKIGKQFKYDFSIPAAVLFAFFPYYVIHSHYITPDITITLFTLLIILFSIKYLKRGQDKHIYIAAVFAAINTAEKYPGLLSFGIVIIAMLIGEINQKSTAKKFKLRKFLQKLLVLTTIYLIALFISAPNLFIEYGKVIDAVIVEARSSHLGADNLGWSGNILFYLEKFVAESNLIILIFIFVGLFACTKFKNGTGILLLFGFAYWVIMSKLGLHWVRWALPMYTAPLLLSSLGMAFAWEKLRKKKVFYYLLFLVIFLSMLEQAVTSLAYSSRMGFTDTRVAALNYCNNNGITSENAIYEGYTPLEPQYFKTIFDQEFSASDKSVDYIILSSQMYSRYFAEPLRYTEEINFYKAIDNDHQLIKEINLILSPTTLQGKIEDITYYVLRYFNKPQNERYNGPTIRIFKIIR